MRLSKLDVLRGLTGPLLVLLILFGTGLEAVALEHSRPAHASVRAISMRFVKIDAPNLSDWNMTLENNGTITAIMGSVCQRDLSTNNCGEVGPVYLDPTTQFYIDSGRTTLFELARVNTTSSTWELHIEFFSWSQISPPSGNDIALAPAIRPPTTEWLLYNSRTNSFIQ